jgi:dihydrofolate reductase
MSLDGFIATSDDDLSWLSSVEEPGEDYGYQSFTQNVDTYLVGRKTYDKIVEMTGTFPQAETMEYYVLTRQDLPNRKNLHFYNGDVPGLVRGLKAQSGKDIYCDGGGETVKVLMEHDLIDEYIISIIPLILGNGKRLFHGGTPFLPVELQSSRQFPKGLVQLRYLRQRPSPDPIP